jgi:outer membrane protein assembly factor BamB
MFRRDGQESRRGYRFDLFDAETGQPRWTQWHASSGTTRHAGLGYGKNSLSSRPVVIGDRFYIRANLDTRAVKGFVYAFDLATGEAVGHPVDTGTHDAGCSVASGSMNALYYRNYQHEVFDVKTRTAHRLTGATRPSCWPNTLPVGGILYAPEGGAGCSCGLSYQLSFALTPERSISE